MTIEGAISYLQLKLSGLNGMKNAPTYPPEAAGVFPFAVSYEASGDLIMESSGMAKDLAVINCEIHVSRVMLAQAIAIAMSFRDPFMKVLMADPTLNGEVSTVNDVRRTFRPLVWAGVETLGYRFEISVKVNLTT